MFVLFSLLFAPVCCVFSTLYAALSSLWFLFPAPVPGFQFPFLLVLCCFRIRRGVVFIAFCVFASVSSFSSVRLLQLGFRSPCLLVGCSTFLHHPSLSYFTYWLRLFVSFFFLLVCLPSRGSAFIQHRFSCLSLVCFIRPCVVKCSSPFSLSPFGSFALTSGLRCLPCGSFASVVFSFSFVFIGLACSVSSLALFLLAPCAAWLRASLSFAFSRLEYAQSFIVLPVLSALSFIPKVLFLPCFPDFVRGFLFLCIFLVIVSSVLSCFVSVFLCFRLFLVRLLSFPWGFSSPFQVSHRFFGVSFIFIVVFPSLQFWYSLLLLLLFIGYSGV